MLRSANILTVTTLAFLLIGNHAFAQRSLPLSKLLQNRVSVTWEGQELGAALERLADNTQISIWLDRRVDRQQTVTIQLDDLPLGQALGKLAQQQSLGISQLGNILYVGPRQTAELLPTLALQARETLEKLPSQTTLQTKRRWLKPQAVSWPRLSEPRSLASDWVGEASATLVGVEQIVHDLWPAQSLPPLPLVDRLVLLLAGFDLTCEIGPDGKSCQIVPIDYSLMAVPQNRPPRAESQPSRPGRSHQVFSLRLENQPVGHILDKFAQQLNLTVVWDSRTATRDSLRERRISCDVKKVQLDELLQNVLAPANLQHQRKDKQITIQEKQLQ